MRISLVSSLLAALAVCSGAATVFAHAEPARVKPGDGAVLAKAPASIEIDMSQDMARQDGANDIDVFDPTGKEVTSVSAVIDNGNRRRLSVALPSSLPTGDYAVKWRSLSADDGDSAAGTLSFRVDPSATPSPGKEVLKEDLLPGGASAVPGAGTPLSLGRDGGGTSWVLVVAVAVGMFIVGSGATYVLVQKKG